MKPKLAFSITAIASVVLAAVIAAEWKSDAPESPPPPPGPASMLALPDPAARVQAAQHDDAYVKEILARPLFTVSRRPLSGSDGNAGAAMAAALKGRLAGVVVSSAGSEALFVEVGKPKAVSVHEGESFEGWTVEKIEPEHVTVRAGAKLETIEPAGDKTRSGAPVMVPPGQQPGALVPAGAGPANNGQNAAPAPVRQFGVAAPTGASPANNMRNGLSVTAPVKPAGASPARRQ